MPTDSVADKMLIYQLGNGGWPKQLEDKSVVNYELIIKSDLLEHIKATKDLHATIDNQATSREITYIVKGEAASGARLILFTTGLVTRKRRM